LLALSFNQPKFCPTASWNHNGITFPNQSIVNSYHYSVFVNTNNTIYVSGYGENAILVWHEDSINPTKIISRNFIYRQSLFVTSNGDIYIDDGYRNGQVQKWIAKTNTFVIVMKVNSSCFGLFVDTNDTLYCSMYDHDQVVKRSLNDPDITSIIVAAGTGSRGSEFNELNGPRGIFVDVKFDLYVSDCFNNRVQLFQSGESNGITVAGYGSPNPTINLNYPTGIVLDAEKYLFIVDSDNDRIVGSSLDGFRCLVGCYGHGSQSNRLSSPNSFSFDRSGNMFVADEWNGRIQKFEYLESSFGKLKKN
jgi:sugar lactone lactonase YvrE